MLVIRMQRTGRTGHAQFRVVAQDSRTHPSSGRVVAYLGSYDPHTKSIAIKKDEIQEYINKGAQPSDRVIRLLEKEGVKLPKWVVTPSAKKKAIKNPEKLRRNRPEEPKIPEIVAESKPADAESDKPTDNKDEPAKEVEDNTPVAEVPSPDTSIEAELPDNKVKEEEPKPDLEPAVEEETPATEEKAEEPNLAPAPEKITDESPEETKTEK